VHRDLHQVSVAARLPALAGIVTATKASWTILEVLQWTTARFSERGLDSPRLDAELLAAHAFGLSRVQLYTQFDRPLLAAELGAYRELVKRRQAGEPVAYLTGRKEFWSLDLAVDKRVLIPRPDTETAVEEALLRLGEGRQGARIADVGTGSGAIALALARARPGNTIFACDVSPDALAVARANAERLGLEVTFFEGDLAAPLAALAPLDLIVANLPYVPAGDIAALAIEVRCEPRLALDGGADGLALVRGLVAAAPALLAPGGALVLEIGQGQAPETAALCRAAGLEDVRACADLGGIERVVSGRRQAET
jgi:release factor glutamine methyltransferase